MSEQGLAPVCILAGGRGTRLGELGRDTPKALVPVAGEPFLFHQLRLLRRHGARRVVLCVGYLAEQIEEAVGDGCQFDLEVCCVADQPGISGTAAAIRGALTLLGEEFLTLYGDTYLRIDYGAVLAAFRLSTLPALMTVLRNENRWDTSNAVFRDGRVEWYDKRHPTPQMAWIDYGLGVFSAAGLALAREKSDLSDVYGDLARRGKLAGFEARERFYDIGTPAALRETDAFLRAHSEFDC